jgi:hypothetical protein
MELKEQQFLDVLEIIKNADGEDMDHLIEAAGFEDYLLRSLFMKISDDELEFLLEERYNLRKEQTE